MKKLVIIWILACMLLAGCAAPDGQEPSYRLGEKMEDFTVVTAGGESLTLSEVLEEKDAVLINLWATWCGSCCYELPVLEEVYLQYQDQVEIIALSIEPKDTAEVIAEFAKNEKLSFPLAQDTPDLYNKFGLEAIPTCLVVDRFGTLCFIGNVPPETGYFLRLLDAFVGEDYSESVVLTQVPPEKPHMAPSAEAALTDALGAAAFNPTDEYTWPMLVSEKDGRSVAVSSNTGVTDTTAAVTVKVEAKAGDAIAVTLKTSTEAAADVLSIQINGEHVKFFGGEHDWTTYACPVEHDGSYEVTLSYSKDSYAEAGEDTVWIDSVGVLSGKAAADALAANPVYPTGDKIEIVPTGCEAREIVFEDAGGVLAYGFTSAKYYLVDADTVTLHATLTPDIDPEGAFFSHMFEGSYFGLNTCMTEDGYEVTRDVASVPESVIPFTAVMMGLDPAGVDARTVLLFRDETNIEAFLRDFGLTGWSYADQAQDTPGDGSTQAVYTIRCVDQNGAAVAGVKVQICDATSCRVVETDAQGLYVLTSAPYAWQIHVLAAPEGYTAVSEETVTAAPNGGEITLTVNKN